MIMCKTKQIKQNKTIMIILTKVTIFIKSIIVEETVINFLLVIVASVGSLFFVHSSGTGFD